MSHFKARVVASTAWVGPDDVADHNIQELIAFCARVSNPANQMNHATSEKLINYLLKHKHFSPFEMANIVLEIETTRDIARQLLRHRSFTFQEFSQRYANPTQHLGFVTREARLQDLKNRQNSIKLTDDEDAKIIAAEWERRQREVLELVQEHYNWAVNAGIALEQARALLPEGLTTSRLYVNGTIRSWIHYIDVRTPVGTQEEHRELAVACATAIANHFPMIQSFNHYNNQG